MPPTHDNLLRTSKPAAVKWLIVLARLMLAVFTLVVILALVFVSPFQSDWLEDFRQGWIEGTGYIPEEYGYEQAGEVVGQETRWAILAGLLLLFVGRRKHTALRIVAGLSVLFALLQPLALLITVPILVLTFRNSTKAYCRIELLPHEPIAAAGSPHLRARIGLLIFLAYIGVQLLVGVVASVVAVATGADVHHLDEQLRPWLALMTVVGGLVSGVVLVLLARRYAWHLLFVVGRSGLGVVSVAASLSLAAAAGAVALAVALVLVGPYMAGLPNSTDLGPFVDLAVAGGWDRITWAFLAIVLVPPIEEFLFRGLLFAAFRPHF